jgi:hypothetical protein
MKVTHIVGLNGTGKSTLARLLVNDLEQRGAVCAVVDSEDTYSLYKCDPAKVVRAHAGIGHLFIEWMPHHFARITPAPGDRIIRIATRAKPPRRPFTPHPTTTTAQEGQKA